MIIVPTGDGVTPFFDIQITVEGVTYTLEFRWNVRLESWFMAMFDADGVVPILVGVRLVADWLIGSYHTGVGPSGAFRLFDTTGRGEEPGFEDLGTRHRLEFWTAADLGLTA